MNDVGSGQYVVKAVTTCVVYTGRGLTMVQPVGQEVRVRVVADVIV